MNNIKEQLPDSEIIEWLYHLHKVLTPDGAILIGAGSENSDWIQLLDILKVQNVTLVEADDNKYKNLKTYVAKKNTWVCSNALISGKNQTSPFFQANYGIESGLLNPEKLRSIWPNIKTLNKSSHKTVTLTSLQSDSNIQANWLVIDCFPALPILKGGMKSLQKFDVIVTRVIQTNINTELTNRCSQQVVHNYLLNQGFHCAAIESDHNPAIGYSLYVRDRITDLKEQLAKVSTKSEILKRELDVSKKENSAFSLDLEENKKVISLNLETLSKQDFELNKAINEKLLYKQDLEELQQHFSQVNKHNDELISRLKQIAIKLTLASTSLSSLEKLEKACLKKQRKEGQ